MNDAKTLAATAEARLCATIMWGGNLDDCGQVTADSFADEACRIVWETLVAEWPDVSPPQVVDALARSGRLDHVGGVAGFTRIGYDTEAESPTRVGEAARDVTEWAYRRLVHRRGQDLVAASSDLSRDPQSLLDDLDEVAAPSGSRLTIWSGDRIGDVPDPEWLVDGMMQHGLSVVFGPWSAGKSFVAVSLAVAVASGRPWWGASVRQSDVLYVAAEGAGGVARRMLAASRGQDVGMDGLHLLGDPINLRRNRDVAELDAAVRSTGAGLLVVDTWARVTAGGDENDNAAAGAAVEALDRIAHRRGCSVVVLHHSRKGDAADPRGAGSLPGAADTMWNVTQDAGGVVELRSSKQKDGAAFAPLRFRIVPAYDSAVLHRIGGAARVDLDDLAVLLPMLQADVVRRGGSDLLGAVRRDRRFAAGLDGSDRPVFRAAVASPV